MNTATLLGLGLMREQVLNLFEEKSPVLVEVRFPHMGTSSDWHLCEEADDLGSILEHLGPGTELHLRSVWDVTDPTGGVLIKR